MKKHTVIFDPYVRGRMRREMNLNPGLWRVVWDIPTAVIKRVLLPEGQFSWPRSFSEPIVRVLEKRTSAHDFCLCLRTCQRVETHVTSGIEDSVSIEFDLYDGNRRKMYNLRLAISKDLRGAVCGAEFYREACADLHCRG